MIVRATLVRIALFSTALGALLARRLSAARRRLFRPSGSERREPSTRARTRGRPRGSPRPIRATSRKFCRSPRRTSIARKSTSPTAARRCASAGRTTPRCAISSTSATRRANAIPPARASRAQDRRAGEVVIGPAGSAGTYSAPLKITVTRDSDKQQVFSQTYQVEAATDGVTAGVFRVVTDPITLPMHDPPAGGRLFDQRRLRGRDRRPVADPSQEEEEVS